MRRYVVRLIGHDGRLVGTRYHLTYQAIDKLAAVSIPQAEMRRLFVETGGNTQAILAPMSEALKARGYDTLMVLPAQAQIVELAEVHDDPASSLSWEKVFDEAKALEQESAALMREAAATLHRAAALLRGNLEPKEAAALLPHVDDVARRVATAYASKG